MAENHNNFLQSDVWRKFQEAVGHRTFSLHFPHPSPLPLQRRAGTGEGDFSFSAGIIEHELPVVGRYFYISHGPMFEFSANSELNSDSELSSERFRLGMTNIVSLAKKKNAGWIRIEPENVEILNLIRKSLEDIRPRRTKLGIWKAPHDMQPREILVMDITKTEEELLAGMKSKTRYNINLAQKRGVSVQVISNPACHSEIVSESNKELDSGSGAGMTTKYTNEFIRLIRLTEKRKGINFHPGNYYRKMLEVIPGDVLKLYVAEYNNKIIAANSVVFYGNTAIYLHGATDDEYRNVMAPYLLQWQAIKDAKKMGCLQYDFGGVKKISLLPPTPSPPPKAGRHGRGWLEKPGEGKWSGITKFKLGFAPNTAPLIFPGSYDIIIDKKKYYLYRVIQKLKCLLV